MSEHDGSGVKTNASNCPVWLNDLKDVLFERMGPDRRKTWPAEIAEAVPKGVNLAPARPKVIRTILAEAKNTYPVKKSAVIALIDRVTALWSRDDLYSDAWMEGAAKYATDAAEMADLYAVWAGGAALASEVVRAAIHGNAAIATDAVLAALGTDAMDATSAGELCAERIADAVLKAVKECGAKGAGE